MSELEGNIFAIYGAANLGKTTAAKEVAATNEKWLYFKFPNYDLPPTGPLINSVLREGVVIPPMEFQILCTSNRRDTEPYLKEQLKNGFTIIAEGYFGTGIASGLTEGVDLDFLEELNKGFIQPKKSILLDGQRFDSGREKNHRFEEDHIKWHIGRSFYLLLASKYGWEIVNANQPKEKVKQDILDILLSS